MKTFLPAHAVLMGCLMLGGAGCGKPQSDGGGPPGDYKVQAVVALVTPQPLEERIRLVASLQARDSVDVVSEISATITELLLQEGQLVSAGDVLVRLDDRKLAARARETEALLALAQTNFERGQELLDTETIAKQEFDRLKAEHDIAEAAHALAHANLEDTVIKARFDGIVTERMVSAGQYVTAGQRLTTLVKTDPLEAVFHAPEQYIGALAVGQKVELSSVAYPNETFTGLVFFVDPRVDARSRTVSIKAEVPNTDGRLKPGMFANLELVLRVQDDALLIPESAVQYRGDQAIVFIMTEDGVADIRPVTVGLRREGFLQVTDGLAPGDRVVAEGYQKMFPGVGIIISPDSAQYGIEPEPQEEPEPAPAE